MQNEPFDPEKAEKQQKHIGEPYVARDTSATDAKDAKAATDREATSEKPGPANQTPGDIGDDTIDRDEGDTSIGGTSITNV